MKTLFFLLFIVTITTGITIDAFGQAHKDSTPRLYMIKKGGMIDQSGTKLAYMDKNNIIKNSAGAQVYFIDNNKNVTSADGKNLGMAKKGGLYYHLNGETVLNTNDPDKERCAVLDPQGHEGIFHKNYKLHNCAIHCYWLEQAKLKQEKAKTK